MKTISKQINKNFIEKFNVIHLNIKDSIKTGDSNLYGSVESLELLLAEFKKTIK